VGPAEAEVGAAGAAETWNATEGAAEVRAEAVGTAGMMDGAAGAATKGPDGGKTEAVTGESAEMGWVEEVNGLAFVPCGEGEDARDESSAKKLAASSTAARARGEAGRSPCP
jgi:hypothetical protein